MKILKSYSNISILFLLVFFLIVSFKFNLWKHNRITVDAPSYYAYLPALFVHHDLKLNFIDSNPSFYKDKIWFYRIENGNKLIKHPIGIAVVLSPFFIIAHTIAKVMHLSQDGYSLFYQNVITIGVWIYLFLGLIYLKKHLRIYFSEKTVALSLFAIVLGTNLLWYASFEAFMSHSISFSFLCIANYLFYKWLNTLEKRYVFMFAFVFALIVLIRPLAITILIFYLLYAKAENITWNRLLLFLKQNVRTILLSVLIFLSLFSIQLFYWKYITGKWVYNPYIDERFIFSQPELISFLFGFRKGLFIYFPLLLFSIVGFVCLFKKYKQLFYANLILLLFTIYLFASWWAWSYGICWGLRPMIDYYAFLAFPLAAGFSIFETKKATSYVLSVLVVFFCSLNLFQTWQYKKGLIHFDDMSFEAYWDGFLKTKKTKEWDGLLRAYNWKRRLDGLPQIVYSKSMISSLNENQPIYFKGANQLYLSSGDQSDYLLACYFNKVTNQEMFQIKFIDKNRVAIKASNGKYLSLKSNEHSIIVADATTITENETFLVSFIDEKSNKIRLQSKDKNFLSIGSEFPYIVRSVAQTPSELEIFSLYLIEDYQGH